MAQRGRKSAASLAVVPATGAAPAPARAAPPAHLSAHAAAAWREIVEGRPGNYFDPGALRLVEVLAVAIGEHRRLAAALANLDPATDPDGYGKLSRALDAQAQRAGSLATKLRLTPQATLDPRAAGRAAAATTPIDRMRAAYLGGAR